MITDLAHWAESFRPGDGDAELAHRALVDTVAVTLAAADEPVVALTEGLPAPLRWAAIGHVLDFDDVHLPSTSHVSVVCAHAALATGGGARHYLAAAGVMARLGTALGREHYRQGWHTTCTAGAPAAAVAAGLSLGLDAEGLARAMALAVPGAGGVRHSFGTSGKALQVGFATDAGVRAARLAAAGASADPRSLEQWFTLVGGDQRVDLSGPAVPGGLAIKLHPCCYAMQRPINTARLVREELEPQEADRVLVTTPEAGMQPLIHPDPRTGLEAKFSMEYAVAIALTEDFPGMDDFTDAAVARPDVRRLVERTRVRTVPEESGDLVGGEVRVDVRRTDGTSVGAAMDLPLGHPRCPATRDELRAKVQTCVGRTRAEQVMELDWDGAAHLLDAAFPGGDRDRAEAQGPAR